MTHVSTSELVSINDLQALRGPRRVSFMAALGLVFAAQCLLGCPNAIVLEDPYFDDIDSGDTSGLNDVTADSGPVLPPEDLVAPSVDITSPDDGSSVEPGTVRIDGTATDDSGIASVFVRVGPNSPVLAQSNDSFRTWWVDGSVPPGAFPVVAVGYDADYAISGEPDSIILNGPAGGPDMRAPVVTIIAPDDGDAPLQTTVLIEGRADDDVAVVRMEAFLNGEVITERTVQTDDFFESWTRLVPLIPGAENEVTFVAYDALGNSGRDTIHLTGRAEVDGELPEIDILSHSDGEEVDSGTLLLDGSSYDRAGIRLVKVRVGDIELVGGEETVLWTNYAFATSDDGYGSWNITVDIDPGLQRIEARAIDVNGLADSDIITVNNVFQPEYTEETQYFLRLREDEAPSTVRLELDRAGVSEVINEDIQREILLLELDAEPLLRNTLLTIKTACGTRWQENNEDPRHDCSLTPLGRTFIGPDGTWRTSAEYSMIRLLTMTPANVEVDGTSIAGLRGIADFIGIGGGFSQILADALGIGLTDEIVGTEEALQALQENLVASHPNTTADGRIPLTMYDAMNDLEPLADTLGPVDGHPGITDPAFPPSGSVFDSSFLMIIDADSNLRWLDGIDLNVGKEYMATVVDTTGPTFNDVLEFDFTDPTRFDIRGLIEDPVVDLRFQILENDSFLNSCNDDDACQGNLPGSPLNNNSIWATPAWQIEHIFARASNVQYAARTYSRRYSVLLVPAARVEIGQNGDPAGWAHFTTLFSLGDPPKDQYLWELITEVAQVALHELPGTTIAEGDANVAFTLFDLSVGITASEIRDAVRPYLQDQASELSDLLLGDFDGNNGAVDFFYRRGADGNPYLFFVAPEDPRPVDDYGYITPGFFSNPQLTSDGRVSSVSIPGSGDDIHHKLRIMSGESTVFMQDDEGGTYRLRIVAGDNLSEISVFVSRRMQ